MKLYHGLRHAEDFNGNMVLRCLFSATRMSRLSVNSGGKEIIRRHNVCKYITTRKYRNYNGMVGEGWAVASWV